MKTRKFNHHACPVFFTACVALFLLALPFAGYAQFAPCCPPGAGINWLQPPDLSTPYNAVELTTGSPYTIGDNFPCTNAGPIAQINLWGTFFNDNDLYLNDMTFTLTIWSDVPAQAGSTNHPGTALWTQTFQPGQYNWCIATNAFSVIVTPAWFPAGPSSTNLYELCFSPPSTNPFVQNANPTAPTNYWLTVSTQIQGTGDTTQFGWKTSASNYNGTATDSQGSPAWTPLYNALNNNSQVNLAFQITTAPTTPAYLNPLYIRSLSRTNCVITWTTGILQVLNLSNLSTPNPSGSYTDVPGATSPYTNTTSLPAQFFRLRSN